MYVFQAVDEICCVKMINVQLQITKTICRLPSSQQGQPWPIEIFAHCIGTSLIRHYKYSNKRSKTSRKAHILMSPVALKLISPDRNPIWMEYLVMTRKWQKIIDWNTSGYVGPVNHIYRNPTWGRIIVWKNAALYSRTLKRAQWCIPSLSPCLSLQYSDSHRRGLSAAGSITHTHRHTMCGTAVTQRPDR